VKSRSHLATGSFCFGGRWDRWGFDFPATPDRHLRAPAKQSISPPKRKEWICFVGQALLAMTWVNMTPTVVPAHGGGPIATAVSGLREKAVEQHLPKNNATRRSRWSAVCAHRRRVPAFAGTNVEVNFRFHFSKTGHNTHRRHCERASEAIYPALQGKSGLLRVAFRLLRNDVDTPLAIPRLRIAPESYKKISSSTTEGSREWPGARCTRSPRMQNEKKHTELVTARNHRDHPAFPAQWFY